MSDLKNLPAGTTTPEILRESAVSALPHNFVSKSLSSTCNDVIFKPVRITLNPGIEILGVKLSLLIIKIGSSST